MKRFKRVYIEITNNCNLNCSFCAPSKRCKQFITPAKFEEILRQISPYTDYIYLHVLGEPLLHPNLDEILTICEKYNKNVNITTNGTLLQKNLEILLKHKVRQINISLHCECENKHSYISSILTCLDKLSPFSFISLRSWLKCDDIIIQKISEHYSTKITNERKQTLTKNVFFSVEKPFIWQANENDENGFCYGMKDMCAILDDGSVTACCIDYDGSINLGNIFKTPFKNIIESEKVKQLVQGFNNKKLICETCKKCEYRKRFDTKI